MSQKFITCSVKAFRTPAILIHSQIQQDPTFMTWQTLLDHYTESYIALVGAGAWGPHVLQGKAGGGANTDLDAARKHISSLQKKLNHQGSSQPPRTNSENGGNNGKEIKCWACGQPGHKKGDPKCPKKKDGNQSGGGNPNRSGNQPSGQSRLPF